MKMLGWLLCIAGAAAATYGFVQTNSWEYQLAGAFGADTSNIQFILYGGIASVVIGLILVVCDADNQK